MMAKSTMCSVYISSEVFGEECYVDLNKDCILEFTLLKALSSSTFKVYIRFIHDKIPPDIRFGFFRPSYMTPSEDFDVRVEFFQRRLRMPDYDRNFCYFLPYVNVR